MERPTLEGMATIPLFTLAGYLLAEGRSSERLLRMFRALVGWMPGGTAVLASFHPKFHFVGVNGGVTRETALWDQSIMKSLPAGGTTLPFAPYHWHFAIRRRAT